MHEMCMSIVLIFSQDVNVRVLHSFPTRRSSDLLCLSQERGFQDRVRSRTSGDHGMTIAPGEVAVYDYALTDRKSTRLNSSHEWISYAVFCLKKKKENTHADAADPR